MERDVGPVGERRSVGVCLDCARTPGYGVQYRVSFSARPIAGRRVGAGGVSPSLQELAGNSSLIAPGLLAAEGGQPSLHRSGAQAEVAAAGELERIPGAGAGAGFARSGFRSTARGSVAKAG